MPTTKTTRPTWLTGRGTSATTPAARDNAPPAVRGIRKRAATTVPTDNPCRATAAFYYPPTLEAVRVVEAVGERPGYCRPVAMGGVGDERGLLGSTLAFLRDAVLRKVDGLSDEQARWTPEGGLLPLVGIVNHLAHVEWRWIDGAFKGAQVTRSEEEFLAKDVALAEAVAAYRERGQLTDEVVRSAPSLDARGQGEWGGQRDLRWILIHLIQETARHAGHADATRELLDGTKGT